MSQPKTILLNKHMTCYYMYVSLNYFHRQVNFSVNLSISTLSQLCSRCTSRLYCQSEDLHRWHCARTHMARVICKRCKWSESGWFIPPYDGRRPCKSGGRHNERAAVDCRMYSTRSIGWQSVYSDIIWSWET